ncbi:MAG: S-layer homology domain-containing protein [Clostridiales bacterium]
MKKLIISAISLVMILSLSAAVSANQDSDFISVENAYAEMIASNVPENAELSTEDIPTDAALSDATTFSTRSGIDATIRIQNVAITSNKFIADTFNGVPAYYAPMIGGSPYQCSEYITRYYQTIYGSSLQGFKVTTTPKAGDYIKATADQRGKGYGHFAVIKSVNGSELTLIEQNWTWMSGGTYYAAKNRVIPYGGNYAGTYTVYTPIGNASNSGGESVATQTFSDVPTDYWAYSYINDLVSRGVVKGKTSTIYEPEATVTREEFVKMLGESSGMNVKNYTNPRFQDVPSGRWSYTYVNWAKVNGIVSGTSDTCFSPDLYIERQDLAVMLHNYAKKFNKSALTATKGQKTFTDGNSIDSYAKQAVSTMQKAGIINGNPNGSFAPHASATRAEAATMLSTLLSK